jgi:hypothetical protein
MYVNGGDATGDGTIALTGGTFRMDTAGNFGGNTNWTFFNLTFGDGSGATTTTKTGTSGITTTNVLTIAASQILDAGDDTWTLSGTTGTPFVVTGTFTPNASTFVYSGIYASGNTTVVATTYWNLQINAAETYVTSGILDVNGNFTITTGTFIPGANMTVAGSWSNSGTFTAGAYTVTFDAGTTGKTLAGTMTTTSAFYNLTFDNAAGGWSFSDAAAIDGNFTITTSETAGNGVNLNGQAVTLTGNFQIDAGKLTTGASAWSVGGNWTRNGGTVVATNSTVTLNGSAAQSVTAGGQSFNNLTVTNSAGPTNGITFADSATVSGTFSDNTPNSKVTFTALSTYAFTTIDIDGSVAGNVTLISSSPGSDPANQWYFNVAGTPVVTYVTVSESDAKDGSEIDATSNCTDHSNNEHWNFGSTNTAPTNDSLTFTNPYGGAGNTAVADNTTSWTFRAVVTDLDGPTDLSTVDIGFANSTDSSSPYNSLRYRWTRDGDAFTEVYDTQNDPLGVAEITSASGDSNFSVNTWTLDFKIKINDQFTTMGSQYAIELYSVDAAAASDTDDYASKYQVTVLSLTLDVDSATMAFGSLLPGSVITGTTVTTVTTNYPNGYSLAVHDGSDTNSALVQGGVYIADYTGTIVTPTLWPVPGDTGLGICVYITDPVDGKNTTQWGAGTEEGDSLNQYAGVPESATIIHSKTGSPTSSNNTSIGYKLVVPNIQKTGAYSGIVTYTATGVLN